MLVEAGDLEALEKLTDQTENYLVYYFILYIRLQTDTPLVSTHFETGMNSISNQFKWKTHAAETSSNVLKGSELY